jgi:hypothetical protein
MVTLVGPSGCGDEEQGSSLLIGVWSGPYVGAVDSGIVRMDFDRSAVSFRGTYTAFGRFGPEEGLVSGDWVEGAMVGVFESDGGCVSAFTATLDTINLLLNMAYASGGDCADTGIIAAHKGEDVSGTWSGTFITPDEAGGVQATLVQNGTSLTGVSHVLTSSQGDSGTKSGTLTESGFEMTGHFSECDATFDVDLTHKAEQMDGTLTMSANCENQVVTIKMSREHEGPFSVTGNWTGTLRDSADIRTINLILSQAGSTVTGTYDFPGTSDAGLISGTMNGNIFTGQPDSSECQPAIRMVMQSDGSRMIGHAIEQVSGNCDGGIQTIELLKQ